MKRATRAVAAATLALSIALGAGACTELAGDFQSSEKACLFDHECPGPTECAVPACSDHLCTSTPVARGTVCTPGCPYQGCGPCNWAMGCGKCDGEGHCFVCEAATDCSIQPGECAEVACVDHQCEVQVAPMGQACSTGVCTMHGTCGECNYPEDCPADAACVKATNACCLLAPAACTTDADCCSKHCSGGACTCLMAADAFPCKADENCCSNKCINQFCAP